MPSSGSSLTTQYCGATKQRPARAWLLCSAADGQHEYRRLALLRLSAG